MRIAAELDPPEGNRKGDVWRNLRDGAIRLRDAGVDFLTIADNPCATAKGDSVTLAALLSRDAGIHVMPHLTCRDRNPLSLKSALLALDLAESRDVLIVTGDPFRREEKEAGLTRSRLSSIALAALIREWNEEAFSAPFRISAALNVNAENFDAELRRAERKMAAGVSRFLTQPVLSERALENVARARDGLDAELFGGLLPIVSQGNADFLARGEIHGIVLSPDVRDRYAGRDKAECARLAVDVSLEFARGMRSSVDGLYVITPFSRVDVVEEIARAIRLDEAVQPLTEPAVMPSPRCLWSRRYTNTDGTAMTTRHA